jgi:hypothetical protein
VNSRNRDVRRIHNRLRRYCACSRKGRRQSHSIRGSVKDPDFFESRQPPAGTETIAACGLLKHERRDVKIEL